MFAGISFWSLHLSRCLVGCAVGAGCLCCCFFLGVVFCVTYFISALSSWYYENAERKVCLQCSYVMFDVRSVGFEPLWKNEMILFSIRRLIERRVRVVSGLDDIYCCHSMLEWRIQVFSGRQHTSFWFPIKANEMNLGWMRSVPGPLLLIIPCRVISPPSRSKRGFLILHWEWVYNLCTHKHGVLL